MYKYDVFISHASEDKQAFANELRDRLQEVNYEVWYDEQEIKPWDRISKKINEGLANSKYGIAVISHSYLAPNKKWTYKELKDLLETEKILPIYYKITKEEIKKKIPPELYEKLDDWMAISSDGEIDHIIDNALRKIGNHWSAKNINYTKLRNHLAKEEWLEADKETYQVMIKAVGKKSGSWLQPEDVLNFPCKDLRTIDQLWVKYSNEQFGFSVQKKIYLELTSVLSVDDSRAWDLFASSVGWKDRDYILKSLCTPQQWDLYSEMKRRLKITFDKGHFPRVWESGGMKVNGKWLCNLLSLLFRGL